MEAKREAVDSVQAMLGKTLRITVHDGRKFTGTFMCVDAELNVVLGGTTETRAIDPLPGAPCQQPKLEDVFVGSIVISRKHWVSCELQQ
eukprot:m51a1_g3331 hypothetical protein (89) ;mRNA; r:373336-373602